MWHSSSGQAGPKYTSLCHRYTHSNFPIFPSEEASPYGFLVGFVLPAAFRSAELWSDHFCLPVPLMVAWLVSSTL